MHVASQTALYVGNPGPVLCICLLVVDSVGRGIGSFVPGYRYLIVLICLYRNQLHFARHNGNCHAFSIFIVCTICGLSYCKPLPCIHISFRLPEDSCYSKYGYSLFSRNSHLLLLPGPSTRLLIVIRYFVAFEAFFQLMVTLLFPVIFTLVIFTLPGVFTPAACTDTAGIPISSTARSAKNSE